MKEQLRMSIEQTIRDHIAQDTDFDNAVREASRDIVNALERPLHGDGSLSVGDCLDLIHAIDATLCVPAAEYVPAIRDVFDMVDRFCSRNNIKMRAKR